MLTIDATTMMISVTRGDFFSIVFSAKDAEETTWHPDEGDTLIFAVAKKLGGEPIISKTNTYDGEDEEAYWTINVGTEDSDDWYKKDEDGNVVLDDSGNPVPLDFGSYVWDLQLGTPTGKVTIIGKSDEMSPKFRIWGEIAE